MTGDCFVANVPRNDGVSGLGYKFNYLIIDNMDNINLISGNSEISGISGNAHILKKSADIIKYAGDLCFKEIKAGHKVTVIFPYRRPVYFLGKYLSDAYKISTDKADMFSIDDFIDKSYETAARRPFPKISPAEASFLIFDLNKKEKTAIIKNAEKLDDFMPWGYKLFADFEELLIELTDPASCDAIIAEKIEPAQNLSDFSNKFSKFSEMYKLFYESLVKHGFSSRSDRYKFIADNEDAPLTLLPGKVIIAGFYGITGAESVIFKKILKNKSDDARIILKTGSGIPDLLKKLGLTEIEIKNENGTDENSVKFYFNITSSIHNEIMKLKMKLKETIENSENKLSSKDLIVLSSEDYLFPLLHNVLNSFDEKDYNVSIGYSLNRTPLYSLFNLLSVLHGRKKEGKFYAKDYISLFLHPYVKNISGKLSGLPQFSFNPVQTRMFFQSIESYIKKNKILFISVKDLENIEPVAGAESSMKHYFAEINRLFISGFENIENIKDFIEKIMEIVDTVSDNSNADWHPYGQKFIESVLTALMEFKGINFSENKNKKESDAEQNSRSGVNGIDVINGIDISSYRFEGISGYFNLLKNILKQQKVPFRGTPLKGLQVLGPLEARMLNFDRVFYLGANEGTVPNVSKENTLLTEEVRKFLNLPGANESARIQEYNFFNLIAGAKEVHFFYNDSNSNEKSRFVEKIIWDIQKKSKNLKEPKETNSVFEINFIRQEPVKIKKSDEIKEYLCNMDYSPGKLDAYLKCPLQFYYSFVLNLRKSEEAGEDIGALGVGNVIHGVLKEYFQKFLNKTYLIPDLENEKNEIHRILGENFNSRGSTILELQKKQMQFALDMFIESRQKDLAGAAVRGTEYPLNAFIAAERCDIRNDYNNDNDNNNNKNNNDDDSNDIINRWEIKADENIKAETSGIEESDKSCKKIKLSGRADLLIEKEGGEHCIIDYKTGNSLIKPNKKFVPSAENRDEWSKKIQSVQLPFYIMLYNCSEGVDYSKISAKLWGVKKGAEYSLDLKNSKDGMLFDSYVYVIKKLIYEIINSDYFDFPQKEKDKKICAYCSYSPLCGRI